MEQATVDPNVPVSHEVDGRILTGVGVSPDALAETMERHAEPDASEPAAPSTPAQPRDDAGKFAKPSRGQRRFDELTREREEARREAAEVKARYEASQRELEQLRSLRQPREPEPEPAKAAATPATPPAGRPKPTEDEIGSKYQSYGEFVEDLADWKAEQRLAALDFDARIRQSIEADRASRTLQERIVGQLTKARETYQDFDAVLAHGPGASVTLGPTVEVGEQRVQAVSLLPNGPQLIYAIAKDGALAQRLAAMTDLEFGMALSSLAPQQAVATPASTPAVVSPIVPPPFQPVGAGSKTTAIPSSDLPKKAGFDYDRSGYREKRAQERAGRR